MRYELVLLDRDGVINRDEACGIHCAKRFHLLPKVAVAMRMLNDEGIFVSVVTNQASVGRGEMSASQLAKIHSVLNARLSKARAFIDQMFVCFDSSPSSRRKPAPGMILEALNYFGVEAQKTIFIGDSLRDLEAADAAGISSALVLTGNGKKTLPMVQHFSSCAMVCDNLFQVVERIV